MQDHEITDKQRDMMAHAVGHLKNKKPRARIRTLATCYRNYYCTEEDPSWEDLVMKGYATCRKANAATGGDLVYHVTESGFALLVQHRDALVADVAAAKKRLNQFQQR